MRFTSAILAAAMAVVAAAQSPNPFTNSQYTGIAVGSSFNITWQPTTPGSIRIDLFKGDPSAFTTPLETIVPNIPNNGYYLWTPDSLLVAGSNYALRISSTTDSSQFNYTPLFSIASTLTATPSSSTAAATSTMASSTSSVVSTSAVSTTASTSAASSTASSVSSTMTSSASSATTMATTTTGTTSSASAASATTTTRTSLSTGAAAAATAAIEAKAAGLLLGMVGVVMAAM